MRFCQTVDGFLPNSPFSQICHFCVNRQLSICLFCCFIVSVLAKFAGFAKYVIFVKPTIIDMPLLSSCFNFYQTLNKFFCQICHFRKIAICQDVLFCHLIWIFGQTLDECLAHSPFLPKFAVLAYICHFLIVIAICQDSPLWHLNWGFAKPLMDSCPIPRFLKFAIFAKIANCQYASFVISFNFFDRPLMIPLPNSRILQNMSFS